MGLYLGSSKKLAICSSNGGKLSLNIPQSSTVINVVMLKSSDNYILKDTNGLYLTTKEGE